MNILKKPASIIAATLILGVGAGTAQAGFFAPFSTGTINATAGCFTFGECTIGGTGNISDNAITVTNSPADGSITYGTGIAGDGFVAIWNFSVGADGNTLTITSFSQDSYTGTAGGDFALFAPGGIGSMTATVDSSGKLDLDLSGRYGIPQFFTAPWPNGQPWNIDNSSKPGPRTNAQKLLTTGSSTNYDPNTGNPLVTRTGQNLALTAIGSNTWLGTLVSVGNVGTAFGAFDGTPYSEQYNITVTGVQGDGNPCAPLDFSFTAQTDVALGQTITSNSQTITGITQTCDITVTNGEYQIGGGAWTSAAGTINAGQQVRVRHTSSMDSSTQVTTTLSVGNISQNFMISRNFISITAGPTGVVGSNFTMLDPAGNPFGGTNDIQVTWTDGDFNTDESDPVPAVGKMTIASVNPANGQPTPFKSFVWSAHHIRVFDQGTYTINTECTVIQLETGSCATNLTPSKNYVLTVGPNQVGAHMLFDWNQATNIDVLIVWERDAIFGPSRMNDVGDIGCNNPNTVWDLMSSDWTGDGNNGAGMLDGPFLGYYANFNIRLPNTTNPVLPCSGTYVPTVNVGDPSGAKGCSISQKPIDMLERGDWWLVAGFLVWLGALRMRFRRQTQS